MADFNIQPVGAQVKPVPSMSLSDMVNMARGVQAYQQALQTNPLELQRMQTELSRLQQLMPEEVKRAQAEAEVSAQTAQPRISTAKATERGATAEASGKEMTLAQQRLNAIANRQTSLINNPLVIAAERSPAGVNPESLATLMREYGTQQAKELDIPEEQATKLIAPYIEMASKNPAGLRTFLKERLLSGMDQGARLGALQPAGPTISTGAGGYQVQTSETGPYPPGAIVPGTVFSAQAGPTTQVVITPDQAAAMGRPELAGATIMVGPQTPIPGVPTPQVPAAKPVAPGAAAPAGPTVTALSPLQAGPIAQTPAMAGEHWKTVQAEAAPATQQIGVLQNIKKYAADAFTGVGGARKELATGVANALGIPLYEAEKTATDVLAKNSNMLALTGGNTDLARTLAEAANPNKKMNVDAIRMAADQLIGIKRMSLAQQNYLQRFTSDPTRYQQERTRFDQVADPRMFQEYSQDEFKKMWGRLSPTERVELGRRYDQAKAMGLL